MLQPASQAFHGAVAPGSVAEGGPDPLGLRQGQEAGAPADSEEQIGKLKQRGLELAKELRAALVAQAPKAGAPAAAGSGGGEVDEQHLVIA